MPSERESWWDLEEFLDTLILELDKAQDTLAMKGLTRRLTYTVKDAALELQIFPRYDEGRIRFATARPGENGASRLSIQLGSITDRQIMETTNEPVGRGDLQLEQVEDLDPAVRSSLQKVGVRSARDLERIERRDVDLDTVVREKTGGKTVNYDDLAHLINKARRRRGGPLVARVSTGAGVAGPELVLEGERLVTAQGVPDYPVATLDGHPVPVLHGDATTLRLALPSDVGPGEHRLEVALDPYAVMRLNVNAR